MAIRPKVMALVCSVVIVIPMVAVAQSQNPIQAMKDAWKKAHEQQKQQQQGTATKTQGRQAPTDGQQPAGDAWSLKDVKPSSAKLDAKLMFNAEPGLEYWISKPGSHVFAVIHRGSRLVASYDGVDGPKFDDILQIPGGTGSKVEFSPDGTRYAYVGRVGPEQIVMVDGKEVLRIPLEKQELQAGAFNAPAPAFTPNNKHFYFLVKNRSSSTPDSYARFYWDGVAGPPWAEAAVISPDGDHYAYYTRNQMTQAVTLMLDGKPAGYLAGEPMFTADGKHLFTKQTGTVARRSYEQILVDGKPFIRAERVRLQIPPVGYKVIAVAVAGQGVNGGSDFLVVGGKKVEGSDCTGSAGYSEIAFSRDGKHWAAICQTAAMSNFVIADGRKGQEYQSVDAGLDFTADGRVVYVARQSQRYYVVVGDQESDGYGTIQRADPTTSAVSAVVISGNRIGFVARRNNELVVVVDRKTMPVKRSAEFLEFSPDGSHFAFVSDDTTLVVDGTVNAAAIQHYGRTAQGNQYYVWSPDSRSVAAFGRSASDPTQYGRGLFVNGKYVPVVSTFVHRLSFSPDGKHFAYMVEHTRPGGGPIGLYIDGRLVGEFVNNGLFSNEAAWQFTDDGVLTAIVQDGDAIKRLRITPQDDSSITTMTGGDARLPAGGQ
jgi:hypothetical protein